MSKPPSRRPRARWAVLATAPLLLAPMVSPADGAVGDRSSNGWAQLTATFTVDRVARPGLAHLPGGTLLVAWREADGASYQMKTLTVAPDNTVGATATPLTWDGLNPDPQVLGREGGADVVFVGHHGSDYFAGGNAYRLEVDGTGTAAGQPVEEKFFPGGAAVGDFEPFDAARQADGTVVVNQYKFWHSGPAAAEEDANQEFTGYPESYSFGKAGLATTPQGTYLAYFTDGVGSDDTERGAYVARVLPSSTPPVKLPGSWYADRPVALSGSTTGVLWAAYCTGTDSCDQLVLRDVLGGRSLVVPAGEYAAKIVLAPAPGGRMWVVWQSGLTAVSAVRTNKAVTRFGPVRRSAPLYMTDEGIDSVAADGSTGPADVVVNGNRRLWHRRYLPVLSASATPVRWKVNRQQKVTFTVRDAGDPLGGATVAVAGRSCTTASTGVCAVTVPARSKPASLTATATRTGYLPASLTLSVVR